MLIILTMTVYSCRAIFNYVLIIMDIFTWFDREIFPEGLPPSYVFVATLQLKGIASKEKFDLWRVLSKDQEVQVAVTLHGQENSITFTTTNMASGLQVVTFDSQGLQVCTGLI